jgi:hypothetical protein
VLDEKLVPEHELAAEFQKLLPAKEAACALALADKEAAAMAMTYNSLTAAKGTSGAVATWVAYTKLDVPVIVDEAQALIYMALRVP